MFCRNCNKEIDDDAIACIGCGFPPRKEKKFCNACGEPTNPAQIICIKCGVSLTSGGGNNTNGEGYNTKIVAVLLAFFLGALGGHKFYLGYTKEATTMLLVTLIGSILIFPALVMSIIGLVEGILYLTKSDEEFVSTYVDNKKGWF
jgi:TM2 domain-containing membrane protein YozV